MSTTNTRTRILEVATELVAGSPDGDISTRAVCEAAQVGAPQDVHLQWMSRLDAV
ncbi:hypothetical protein I3W98_25000, partial [Streptomyces cavourensis]|nr:hypothetical protein [Streptomyces cavourensis]